MSKININYFKQLIFLFLFAHCKGSKLPFSPPSYQLDWNLQRIDILPAWKYITDCRPTPIGLLGFGLSGDVKPLQKSLSLSQSRMSKLVQQDEKLFFKNVTPKDFKDLLNINDTDAFSKDDIIKNLLFLNTETPAASMITGYNTPSFRSVCQEATLIPLLMDPTICFLSIEYFLESFSQLIEYATSAQIKVICVMNMPYLNIIIEKPQTAEVIKKFQQTLQAYPGLLVVSAGDADMLGSPFPLPSFIASLDLDHLISVTATGPNDELSAFFAVDKRTVHIAAPGYDLQGLFSPNTNDMLLPPYLVSRFCTAIEGAQNAVAAYSCVWSSSSMAAAHVAAAISLFWSFQPELYREKVKTILLENADQIPHLRQYVMQGRRLNIGKMFEKL